VEIDLQSASQVQWAVQKHHKALQKFISSMKIPNSRDLVQDVRTIFGWIFAVFAQPICVFVTGQDGILIADLFGKRRLKLWM